MKGIIGAICGDIIGSTREREGLKSTDFELYPANSRFTDDTIMTVAIASWILEDRKNLTEESLIKNLKYFGNNYPSAGYGGLFLNWLEASTPEPYNSWGNGSAMRVSPVAWIGNSVEEVEQLAEKSAKVTHNHPEGIKGAKSVAAAIYLAKTGKSKNKIKEYIEEEYKYDLSRDFNRLRGEYSFDASCQGSVPESIMAFLVSNDYESTIRNAISLGGDADTQAAIAGSIASAYWEVPQDIYKPAIDILNDELRDILFKFNDISL
ncbi:ADP-ribosylglycohydrolase family protein [Methanobrevibacter woesei]|uniref:ADP-ribosylglycohydrolase family protein n=1 Tax=Methanobrevibacter woesei TaxID=190976 RepID=UPI003209F4EA